MQQIHVTEEYLRSIDVHTLLPQQEPFVMIGALTHFELETCTTQTLVHEDNIFVDNGFFSPSGMMENIAQTCAARMGFYNKYLLRKDVQVGFIGSVRNFVINELAPVGSTITTRIDIREEVFGVTLASAQVSLEDRILATAEVKLAVRNAE